MDGMELVRTIKNEALFPAMKIIVVSSAGNPAREQELAQFGVRIIAKPISPAKLATALEPEQEDTWGTEDAWGE